MAPDIMRFITRQTSRGSYALRHYTRGLGLAKRELDQVQEMTRDELLEFQDMKLRRLIQYCRQRVPFYQQWFEGRDFPTDTLGRDSQAWRGLPVLTKEDIQTHGGLLMATDAEHSNIRKNATGGSTGEPLQFWQDDNYWRHNTLDLHRSYEMCGWRPGDRVVHLWGADIDAADHVGVRGFLVDRFIHNRLFVNTFGLESREMEEWVGQISGFGPDLVIGYASSLDLFADAIQRTGISVAPKAVQSSAEMLDPKVRERVELAFNAPVFDRYGGRECGVIAHECEFHTGWHIFSNTHLVEILDDNWKPVPPAQMGNIVVTNLNNYAMPLVRYAVGDVAAVRDEGCQCGRALPQIGPLGGRKSATFRSPCGKMIPGQYFIHFFRNLKSVKRYQLIQRDLKHIEIRIVGYPECDKARIAAYLQTTIPEQLDDQFIVEVYFDKSFEMLPSGKLEFVISKISAD